MRNGVFKTILHHADPSEQKYDVSIFSREFMCSDQQFQSIHWASLIYVNLCERIKNLRRIWSQTLRALQDEFGFRILRGLTVNLSQVEENLKRVWLQRIGFF